MATWHRSDEQAASPAEREMGNVTQIQRARMLFDLTAAADSALFNALTDEAAVVDGDSRILVVCPAWQRFLEENGGDSTGGIPVGQAYRFESPCEKGNAAESDPEKNLSQRSVLRTQRNARAAPVRSWRPCKRRAATSLNGSCRL